jgi:hypothetical protein
MELIRLFEGRDSAHAKDAKSIFAEHVPNVALALRFIRTFVADREITSEMLFPNEGAVVLLFGRVYHQLRAATLLALHGYYTEVWSTLRAAYECASLARYLSKNVERAEAWFKRGSWIKEGEVHKSAAQVKDDSEILYRHLSEMTHPTLRSCAILLDTTKEDFALDLAQPYAEDTFLNCMQNIDGVSLWACFALRNCLPSRAYVPPDAQQTLEVLAERVAPSLDWSNLRIQWKKALSESVSKASHVQPAAELSEALQKYAGRLAGPPAQTE